MRVNKLKTFNRVIQILQTLLKFAAVFIFLHSLPLKQFQLLFM